MSHSVDFEPAIRFGVGSSDWEIRRLTINGGKSYLTLSYVQHDPIVKLYGKRTGSVEWHVPDFVSKVLDKHHGQSYAWVDTTALDVVAQVTRAIDALIWERNKEETHA